MEGEDWRLCPGASVGLREVNLGLLQPDTTASHTTGFRMSSQGGPQEGLGKARCPAT